MVHHLPHKVTIKTLFLKLFLENGHNIFSLQPLLDLHDGCGFLGGHRALLEHGQYHQYDLHAQRNQYHDYHDHPFILSHHYFQLLSGSPLHCCRLPYHCLLSSPLDQGHQRPDRLKKKNLTKGNKLE